MKARIHLGESRSGHAGKWAIPGVSFRTRPVEKPHPECGRGPMRYHFGFGRLRWSEAPEQPTMSTPGGKGMAARAADTVRRPRISVPEAQETLPPLVEAKLSAPRVPRGLIDRPRIRHALEAEALLTLVGAPAGYGKTTAIRTWCATQEAALAWVTLDSSDDDPSRMWTYVATAVDRIRPGLGLPAMRRISVPGEPDRARHRRAAQRRQRVRAAGDPGARRPPHGDRPRLSGVDRPCPPAHARERARDRRHAHRSGARPLATAGGASNSPSCARAT